MIAFSAGGRCIATWSELKPPQEMPIIPTLPLHQGCCRDPGDRRDQVGLLRRRVFVVGQALGIAGAAQVDPQARIAVAGEIGIHLLVAALQPIALAIRQAVDDRRHRISRRHPPATTSAPPAGRRPFIGIHRFSTQRMGRGNSRHHLHGSLSAGRNRPAAAGSGRRARSRSPPSPPRRHGRGRNIARTGS